ncbi:MAG: hypothetical protein EA376_09020 [Phycisphaeraceae bacterium]|nr:MAG: hypothetical protein EA376_09020 [Phycisphaeraceae bacterium]
MKKRLMEYWVMVTADPKKASILGGLVVVALVMWVRAGVLSKSSENQAPGPRQAGAAQQTDIGSGSAMDRKLASANRIELPSLTPLERNLFLPSERYFPLPSQTEVSEPSPAKSPIRNDDIEQEDEAALAARHEQRIREQAKNLRVRSIMLGSSPTAVIETHGSRRGAAQVLRIGQQIEGFTLIEVHRSRVVVEQDGIRVALTLATP